MVLNENGKMAITRKEYEKARRMALKYLRNAKIAVRRDEAERIEVADFGLGDLKHYGLEILVYVNTERVCAKELVMFPRQICPQHRHPPVGNYPGKEETFRCRWGTVYLYVPGPKTERPKARIPKDRLKYFTVWHEVILRPGDQYTLPPDTWHWFQAGPRGAIVSEFSTRSIDEKDIFLDPDIERITKIVD